MRYCSIDIETTGLDPSYCQILEFACVIEDTENPGVEVHDLPMFRRILHTKTIIGEPFALHMNSELLFEIATSKSDELIKPAELLVQFRQFLIAKTIDPHGVVAAGKNFGSFDLQFIRRLENQELVHFSHRSIDPAFHYWKPDLDGRYLPSFQNCLTRAEINKSVTHRATDDAQDIIRLIRAAGKY
jgi:oligoribonuclease (3'-5' exoribonuclease)